MPGASPPGPAPGPAPSGNCSAQLVKDGCSASAGQEACDTCAGKHQSNLRRAGCTSKQVQKGCSGFVSVDDEGTPCAGFRQCGSTKGATGLNPAAHTWDVPMEVRCAENLKTSGSNLTEWSDPIWIYQVSQLLTGVTPYCRC